MRGPLIQQLLHAIATVIALIAGGILPGSAKRRIQEAGYRIPDTGYKIPDTPKPVTRNPQPINPFTLHPTAFTLNLKPFYLSPAKRSNFQISRSSNFQIGSGYQIESRNTNIQNAACDNRAAFAFLLLNIQSIANNYFKLKTMRLYTAILIIIFSSFSQLSFAAVFGPGSAWSSCRRITLSSATAMADFQVKVTLTTAIGNPYTNINTNGSDLRFYDINNNVCNYWIESFVNTGTSVIWVKVASSGATALYMYYGNAAATTVVSSGANTFDFFDDFTSFPGTWSTTVAAGTGSSVMQSASIVTLTCGTTPTGSAYLSSPFTPSASSFVVETKHREGAYNRNRFYATTGLLATNPFGFDYGYFSSGSTATATAPVYWSGVFQTPPSVSANTDYLTQWQITDGAGNPYNWSTYTYSTMGLVRTNTTTNSATPVRFITYGVTEAAGTTTIVDWARVRKWTGSTDITSGAISNPATTNLAANISSQTNVLCNGLSTGAATVTPTGGSGVYTYSWNSSPVQTTAAATNLPAGTYTVIVTENSIGISATATATITQPTALSTSFTKTDVNCFSVGNGTIVVTGSGGVSPYMYSKDNGGAYQGSNSFTSLIPGLYKIRIKDANNCQSKSVP